MLIVSAVLSLLLLAIANTFAYRSNTPGPMIFWTCLVFLVGPVFLGVFSPPLALLAVLLAFALIPWKGSLRGPSFFRSLSLRATLISFGVPGAISGIGYARLRAEYPYESMETGCRPRSLRCRRGPYPRRWRASCPDWRR